MRLDTEVKNELAKPRDWGLGKSSKKGTDLFWMEFILPDLIADDGSQEVTIRKDWYLTPNTYEYFFRDITVMGWHGADIDELRKENPNGHSFYDKDVLLTTKSEKYVTDNGETRTVQKVQFINGTSFVPAKPMESADVKALNAKIKGKLAAYRNKNSPVADTSDKNEKKKADPIFADAESADDSISF